MKDWKLVPIPNRMQHLPKDSRGYPVPYIILHDDQDKYHFQINDERKVKQCLTNHLCAICGQRLDELWLVGGPMSAFHPHGAYIDTPTHHECGTYALQVCPYLAAPKYLKRLDASTLTPVTTADGTLVSTYQDPTMIPDRPGVFVYARTSQIQLDVANRYLHPKKPWLQVEYWKWGQKLTQQEFDEWVLTADLPKSLLFPDA